MLTTIAALIFTVLSALVGVFQLALVFGAPWGEVTLGGRYKGALPKHIRVAPAVSAVLIFGFAVIVLARAGLAFYDLKSLSAKLIWGVAAYCFLGSLMNYITPSKRERVLWFPIVAAMLICSLLVAWR
jgi:hypothetical protein